VRTPFFILFCAIASSVLAQAPSFLTALPDDILAVDPITGTLTYGIQLADADSDSVTLSASSSHPGVQASVSSSNRFARLNIVENEGTPIGSIVFEIFETRGGAAAERFITLATTHPDGGANTFYTDSPFHRVAELPGLILQAGHSSSGSTGSATLGSFDDQFELQDGLNFSEKGVVAMANSGPDTNNSQFFITDGATTHLDGLHMIFGQVISGQSVITTIGSLPRNGSSEPQPTPRIASVDIFDSIKGGALSVRVQPGFAGDAEVIVVAEDSDNNRTEHSMQVHVPMTVHATVLPAPNNPVGTAFHSVRDVNDVLYVANGARGLEIYDVSDPTAPFFLDRFDTVGVARHVSIAATSNPPRTVAFVSDSANGFLAIDVSNPASVFQLDHVAVDPDGGGTLHGTVYLSEVRDGIAYVAEGDGGFTTLDVSDPTQISGPLGSLDLTLTGNDSTTSPAHVVALALNGNTAYASLQNFGVIAITIDSPNSLLLAANKGFGSAWGIAFENNRLYVTQVAGEGALHVYDVSSPRSLVLLGTHQLLGFPWQVDVRGDLVAVSHSPVHPSFPTGGFSFLDISDPAGISTHFFYSTTSAVSPTIDDDYVFLPLGASGVLISDVRSLSNPEISFAVDGNFVTPGTIVGFGTLDEGGIPVEHTLRVYNDGPETLTLGSISLPAGYSRIGSLPSTLLPNTFAEISIRLQTDIVGDLDGDLSFSTNDPSENPARLPLTGSVVGAASISGNVTTVTSGNPALPGVLMALQPVVGGSSLNTQTAADGSYSFAGLVSGSYLVTPSIPDNHQSSNPSDRAIIVNPLNKIADVDFAITPTPATISGFIWDDADADGIIDQDELPLTNVAVLLFQSDTLIDTQATGGDGRYTFTGLSAGDYRIESAAVADKIPSTRPNPREQTVDWGDSIQFADFNYFTPPTLSVAEFAIGEESGKAQISLILSFDIGVDVTAEFATVAESASEGSDFTPVSGALTIPARSTSTVVTVPIIDDGFAEFAETFLLSVSNLENATLAGGRQITITDTDLPRLDISASTPETHETGQVPGAFTIVRRGVLAAPITVDLVVTGSSNIADYEPIASTLTFTPSDFEKVVSIAPFHEGTAEGSETVTITLQRDPSHRIGADSATVTILDGDSTDLAVSITSGAQTLAAGAPIILNLVAKNLGSSTVPSTSTIAFAIHLSQDEIFGNTDDISLEQVPAPLAIHLFPSSSTIPLSATLWIPTDAPAGNYRVIARIDSEDRFIESNEGNNTGSTAVEITLQQDARAWRFPIAVAGANHSELRIGMVPGASDSADSFDIVLNVSRAGSVRLQQGNDDYLQDIRPVADSASWRLIADADAEDIVLSWAPADMPSDRGLYVTDEASGEIRYFMQISELRVPAGSSAAYRFDVVDTQSTDVSVSRGWNLSALPIAPLQPAPNASFGPDADPVHTWRGEWQPSNVITALEGIWLFSRRAYSGSVVGMPPPSTQVDLAAGWHAYGPIVSMPASVLGADIVWEWTGGHFSIADQLNPGSAYLFYSSEPLSIELAPVP
jgi:peptidyl-prolyl cis-trans isomerase A (cyclophilin A)